MGAQIAGTLLVPVVLGIYADRWLESSPWGVLLGTLLGFAGVLSIMIRMVLDANRKSQFRNKKFYRRELEDEDE